MDILSLVPGGQLTILGVIGAAVLWVFRWFFKRGQQSQRLKQAKADDVARRTAREVDDEIDRLNPATAREELKRWSQDR